jgi:hypothetical protein
MKRASRAGRYLTLRQAEADYGLPYHTLWTLVDQRRLPRLELPGVAGTSQRSIYIKRADLEAFLDAHMSDARVS